MGILILKGIAVFAFVVYMIYYIITITSQRIAIAGDMPIFLGVWLSSIIILPVGIFITIKATTDSALLDGESWKKTFRKLFKRNK